MDLQKDNSASGKSSEREKKPVNYEEFLLCAWPGKTEQEVGDSILVYHHCSSNILMKILNVIENNCKEIFKCDWK